jgi:hypothetical protein
MWFLPFEQQMVQLQNSISECLHHHTLFNMFFDGISKANHVWIVSCSGSRVNVWLTSWLVFPAFQLYSSNILKTFRTQLRLPHPLIANIPLTPWVSTFYVAFMAMNKQEPIMQFATLLLPLHEMLASMWDENNNMRFFQPCSTFFINKLTCSQKITFCTLVNIIIFDPMRMDLLP